MEIIFTKEFTIKASIYPSAESFNEIFQPFKSVGYVMYNYIFQLVSFYVLAIKKYIYIGPIKEQQNNLTRQLIVALLYEVLSNVQRLLIFIGGSQPICMLMCVFSA